MHNNNHERNLPQNVLNYSRMKAHTFDILIIRQQLLVNEHLDIKQGVLQGLDQVGIRELDALGLGIEAML